MIRSTGNKISGSETTPPAPTADSRADAAVRWHCAQLLERMRSCEAGILENRDAEYLHDYRVALRRSRALLGQMKGLFSERDTRRYRQSLEALGELTGPLRDHHVMLAELPAYAAALPLSMRPALVPLRSYLEQASVRAYRALAEALRNPSYRRSLDSWRAFVDRPAPKRGSAPLAHAPVAEVCSRRIWKLYRRMLREGADLGPESPPEAFHALRKRGKKLRYLLEFFAMFLAADKVQNLIAQLKALQDTLGEYQDAAVQQARLIAVAEALRQEGQPLETLLAIGVLVAQMEQRQARCRQVFQEGYEAFAKKSTRRHFRKLFGPEPSRSGDPAEEGAARDSNRHGG